MTTPSTSTPLATAFLVLLGALLIVLLIGWCCKHCARNKAVITSYEDCARHGQRYYITAIDVQTGLPVLIRATSMSSTNNSIQVSAGRNSTHYGAIPYDVHRHQQSDVISRSPPPPYSPVVLAPPRQQ